MTDLVERLKSIVDGYGETRSLSDRLDEILKRYPPPDPYVPKCYSYLHGTGSYKERVTVFQYASQAELCELYYFLNTRNANSLFSDMDDYGLMYQPEIKRYNNEWTIPFRLIRSRGALFSCNSLDHFTTCVSELCPDGMYVQWVNDPDFASDLANMRVTLMFSSRGVHVCSDRTDDEFNHLWTMMKLRWE